MSKIVVANFWLQKTKSYPDGAPQREEYTDDAAFAAACRIYEAEWRNEYTCANKKCTNRDCPQHFPTRYSSQVSP